MTVFPAPEVILVIEKVINLIRVIKVLEGIFRFWKGLVCGRIDK